MKHYVVANEWASDRVGDGGSCIVGVTHSRRKARKIFNRTLEGEMRFAEEHNYEIITNNEEEFDAGLEGEYFTNHTHLYIWEV